MNQKDERKCENILEAASLRKTEPRMAVLSALLRASRPMSQEKIAAKLSPNRPNKVTIYRTLETLVKKRVVHKAFLEERVVYYEISDRCTEQQCHPHFTCRRCGETRCIPEVTLPMAKNPLKGFEIIHQQVRLEGFCPECSGRRA